MSTIPMPVPKKKSNLFTKIFVAAILLMVAAGGVYWHLSGMLNLTGRITGAIFPIYAETQGQVVKVAPVGEFVDSGESVVVFENAELQEKYANELHALVEIEKTLPPSLTIAKDPSLDVSEEGLKKAMEDEKVNRQRVAESSTMLANAAVSLRRAMILKDAGKVSADEYQTAFLTHARLETVMEAAQSAYEQAVEKRIKIEASLRREKELRRIPGMDEVSVKARLRQYEVQLQRTEAAKTAMDSTIMRSPAVGKILDILVRPGEQVVAGQQVATVSPFDVELMVEAPVDVKGAAKLLPGQVCSITLPDFEQKGLKGVVHSVIPTAGESPSGYIAKISILEDDENLSGRGTGMPQGEGQTAESDGEPSVGESLPMLTFEGARADIVIHLRENIARTQ